LVRAIREWLNDDTDIWVPDPTTVSRNLHTLITEQAAIGWRQIFNGRFSSEWSRLQDQYSASMDTERRTKSMTGDRWQAAIIGDIWDKWLKLWEMRNKDLHGASVLSRNTALRLEAEQTLDDIYSMREHLEPQLQNLLRKSVVDHRGESIRANQNWIAVHGKLFREGLKRARDQTKQGMRSILSYFRPVP
jgi:hypothetical protein